MAKILQLNPSTYRHLETDEPPKEVTKLKRRAYYLGLTMDWLAGVEGAAKWGRPVWTFRHALLREASTLSHQGTVLDRCRRVIEIARGSDPPISDPWFIPAVLGISEESVERIMTEDDPPIGNHIVDRLADLTGVAANWFLLGGDLKLTAIPEYALPYGDAVAMFRTEGIRQDEIMESQHEILRLIRAKRALVED